MARVADNLPEVVMELERFAASFGMHSPGRDSDLLVDQLRKIIAEGNYHRYVLDQKTPGGSPLAPLAESTLEYKARRGYPDTILVREGLMLSFEQLMGEITDMDESSFEIKYGTSEKAEAEMTYATEGSRKQHRPKRPGYDIDDATANDMTIAITESFDRLVDSL